MRVERQKAHSARAFGRNVLKPRISSRWPLNSSFTCWMTPLVSILCRDAAGVSRVDGRSEVSPVAGRPPERLLAGQHALLRLELLHDLQEVVVDGLVVHEASLHLSQVRQRVVGGQTPGAGCRQRTGGRSAAREEAERRGVSGQR